MIHYRYVYQHYYQMPAGLYITQITPDSDAALQGVEEGDLLLSVNNTGITTMEQWLDYVKNNATTASTAGVGSTWHIPAALIAGTIGADVT